MKLLRLNEKKFKSLIRESIYKVLNETYLLEYALKRKEFLQNVRDIVFQLIENWCLIHYCTLTSSKNELKEHWKTEFFGHMSKIIRTKIKDADNLVRLKAIKEAFNDMDLYESSDLIFNFVSYKFIEENIELNEIVHKVCEDCFNSINDIAYIASLQNDFKSLKEYIQTI